MRGCAEAGPRPVFSEILGILGYTNTVFVCFHTYSVYIPYKIMIHSVGIITDLIVFVCLFWQIGREGLILMEEFTTLITSIGPPPGSGLGEVSSSLPPAPPLIKRQH